MYTAPSDYASFLATASEREPLRLVVRVNKGIREVIGISRRVNLVALNAMLAAQQSGAQARGFAVVSSELRQFSGQLDQQMRDLDRFIYSLVHTVAEAARIHRHRGHFEGVADYATDGGSLTGARQRIDTLQQEIDDASDEGWRGLRQRLNQALRLCGTGVALSRAAKIEAVYGSSPSCDLRQVAEDIERAILSILGTLKQLHSDVAA